MSKKTNEKITINFNKKITDLKGDDIKQNDDSESVSIKTVTSNLLVGLQKQENPIKVLDLALKIYNSTGPIEVDKKDIKIIEDNMKSSQYSVLIIAQVLKALSAEG